MMLSNKLMGGVTAGEDAAEGVDFDGVNDYLSRSTDLVGNIDSKTFTFSCFGYFTGTVIKVYSAHTYEQIEVGANGELTIVGSNSAGAAVLHAVLPANTIPKDTFFSIQASFDLANVVNRHIVVNSIDKTVNVNWITYTNDTMDFTRVEGHQINAMGGTSIGRCRLSHVFLDYTYRDLSIEANRRLFITADGKPTTTATLKALNPILYLPMKDAATAHINEGTGGNFTLNGVIARSGRGPNQFNAPYSYFDGTADYLSRTAALSGITGSKTFTLSFTFNADAGFISSDRILTFRDSGDLQIFQVTNQSGKLSIVADGTPNTADALVVDAFTIVAGRNYTVQISVDLVDTSKRHVYVNGESFAATWSVYGNIAIAFASASRVAVASNLTTSAAALFSGNLGELYFDTKYIDLSVADNLAKFVTGTGIDAKPADLGANGELPFGTPPLIYLPMYGDNAGKNYGTGGDFTVNSGPYTGARGPNEFWENKADFDGTTGYLSRTSQLSGGVDGKTFSCSFWLNSDITNGATIVSMHTAGDAFIGQIAIQSSGLRISWYNSAGTQILDNSTPPSFVVAGTLYHVCVMVDMTNSANSKVFVDGVQQSYTWTTFINDTLTFDEPKVSVGARNTATPSQFLDGRLSGLYFTTDYIDFSQEVNRNKFVDQLGYPKDLKAQIESGAIPNPLIYLPFNDTANLGKNLGTGGDFTVNGTVTAGADVLR